MLRVSGPGAWEAGGVVPGWRELWRVGGTRDGEELVFPVFPAVSADGWLAIPDFALGEVAVVSPEGRWQGNWTPRGDGPGEVRRPIAAAWDAEGRLRAFDLEGSRIVSVRTDGPDGPELPLATSFTGPALASGTLSWAGLAADGTAFLLAELPPAEGERAGHAAGADRAGGDGARSAARMGLLRLPPAAAEPETLAVVEIAPVLAPEWPLPAPPLAPAVGGSGWAAVGRRGADAWLEIHGSRGTPELRICLDRASRSRARWWRSGARLPARSIVRVLIGAGGRIWVERSVGGDVTAADALLGIPGGEYDVLGPEGAYLGRVRAPPGARLQAMADDTVWAFETGPLDETWVVAYRLERSGAASRR